MLPRGIQLMSNRLRSAHHTSIIRMQSHSSILVNRKQSMPTNLKSNRDRLVDTFKDIEKQLQLPVSHFVLPNLVQSEHDISHFAISRAKQLQNVLRHVQHPIYEVAQQLFSIDMNSSDEMYDSLLNQNQISLGALVLLLNAHCFAQLPAYKTKSPRESWSYIPNPITTEESLRNFLSSNPRNKLQRQLALAECYELMDKAIYIHDQAVMNFPLQQFLDENEQHPYFNDELVNPMQATQSAKWSNPQTETVLTFSQLSNQNSSQDEELDNDEDSIHRPNHLTNAFERLTDQQRKHCDQINSGNKLSVLGGDYLFSFGIVRLAEEVRDTLTFDFVGAAIDEYVVAQFPSQAADSQAFSDIKLPSETVNLDDYELKGGSGTNKLLAYCLSLAAHLSELSSIRYQHNSFQLGRYLKLKWNVEEDLKWLHNKSDLSARLFSLPVVLHIIDNPSFATKLRNDVHNQSLDIVKIKEAVSTPKILQSCDQIRLSYQSKAFEATQELPNSDSLRTLQKLICL